MRPNTHHQKSVNKFPIKVTDIYNMRLSSYHPQNGSISSTNKSNLDVESIAFAKDSLENSIVDQKSQIQLSIEVI
jgi:hypothetical protein